VLVFIIFVSKVSNTLFNDFIKDMIYKAHTNDIPKSYKIQLIFTYIECLMCPFKSDQLLSTTY